MSFELERLEDRLALSPLVPSAPSAPTVAAVIPAENEARLDPLLTRLGPRQETTPLFPAAPGVHAAARLDPAAPVVPDEGLEDEFLDDGCDGPAGLMPMIDAPPRPSEATSDQIMSDPAAPGEEEGPEGPEGPVSG